MVEPSGTYPFPMSSTLPPPTRPGRRRRSERSCRSGRRGAVDGACTTSLMIGLFAIIGIDPAQLNYSMLQNRGNLFDEFRLHRAVNRPEKIDKVRVCIELLLGTSGPCSWEGTFDIAEREVPSLGQKVRLPLISDLQRHLPAHGPDQPHREDRACWPVPLPGDLPGRAVGD